MTGCAHPDFEARVNVTRLSADGDAASEVHAFTADITVRCAVCGEPFGWKGPPVGLSSSEPRVSADALELRAPLMTPAEMLLAGPGHATLRGPMIFEAP